VRRRDDRVKITTGKASRCQTASPSPQDL